MPENGKLRGPRTLVIAEIGSTHDGSFGNAKRLIDAARESRVDAVKFQTHIAEAETLLEAPSPPYFTDEQRFPYFKRTAFTKDQWVELKAHAETRGLLFLSSPFSIEALDLLEEVGIEQYKIPSGEVSNIPMLEVIAKTGKPALLSSGMSSWQELDQAVDVLGRNGGHVTLLQCSSEYPCPDERVGLNAMLEMRERYGLPVGLSDHTIHNYAAFAAVALGATVIEKHFTMSRWMYGSDARFSIEPHEMVDLVRGVRSIEIMLTSKVDKDDLSRYVEVKEAFEKSVVSLADIPAGAVLTKEMIGVKKPGTGIPARRFNKIIGKRLKRSVFKDTLIKEGDLQD